MNIKIYTRKNDPNDAVNYYLQLIRQALEERYGACVEPVSSIKDIARDDVVVTISPAAYFLLLLKNPNQKIIYWFQGIFAEEVAYLYSGLKNALKVKLFTYLEHHILKHALLVIFISESMRQYYRRKCGYDKTNYVIIPCFNKQKTDSVSHILADNGHKYDRASFVYAGSVNQWQCIEETVYLFSLIKKRIEQATLTLLTADKKEAQRIAEAYHVSAEIKYIPLKELDKELQKYKYGFILRRDIPLNRVSTPTKLSSYLANGVIPVYSTVIDAFQKPLAGKHYAIPADMNDLNGLCERICSFDSQPVDIDVMEQEYTAVFDSFYNEVDYKRLLIRTLDRELDI